MSSTIQRPFSETVPSRTLFHTSCQNGFDPLSSALENVVHQEVNEFQRNEARLRPMLVCTSVLKCIYKSEIQTIRVKRQEDRESYNCEIVRLMLRKGPATHSS